MRMEADASDIEEFDTESDDDEDMEGPLDDTDRPGPGPGPARAPRPGVDVAEITSADGDEVCMRLLMHCRCHSPFFMRHQRYSVFF
jgi:hypothetical protein